jgi:undecaprenyl diphosphate synthase
MSVITIQCLGFIMDGNRRWAKEQGLETMAGHAQGHEVFKESVEWVRDAGIPHAVYYAFSTENWKRKPEEVSYLMELFSNVLASLSEDMQEKQVRVRIVGKRADFSEDLQKLMSDTEEKSKKHTETTVWIALSYGGRAELVEAVNQAVAAGIPVSEESFEKFLWTADMPEPDMIVRTSGEHRLSNFMTWKSVYSELLFLDKHWPALTKDDFKDILTTYESRERRKGV